MKKTVLAAAVATLALTSCSSIHHTASTETIDTELYNRSYADLNVQNKRVSLTYTPTKAERKAGIKSVKAAAIAKLLKDNGNADVLVAPEFEIKYGGASRKVKYVTVSGRPASYSNVHSANKAEAEIINLLDNAR